jgi:hypothetical protein
MFLSKYSLGKNKTISSMIRTQCTPYFFVAEYYCLRNTTSFGGLRILGGLANCLDDTKFPCDNSLNLFIAEAFP